VGEAKWTLKGSGNAANTEVASFHRFDTVAGMTIDAPNLPQHSVDYCSPFASLDENMIKYRDASAVALESPVARALHIPLPETIPDFRVMPKLPAVFRKKRSNPSSDRSGEPVDASTRQCTFQVTPGATPSWATQPWHYVFQVSAFLKSEMTINPINRMGMRHGRWG